MDSREAEDINAEFIAMISILGAVYGRELDELVFIGYWRSLSDQPLEALSLAVDEALRTEKYLPAPATLLKICKELRRERSRLYIAPRDAAHTEAGDERFREMLRAARDKITKKTRRK